MSADRRSSLEAARQLGKLDDFAREHPSRGNRKAFKRLLKQMLRDAPSSAEPDPRGIAASDSGQT